MPRPAPTSATGAPTAIAPSDENVAWDPKGPPPQQFGNPVHCITITNDALVVVCDRSHNRMQMFRRDGTFVREISVLKESAPGTIGSIVKWPDAAQTYLLVVDDPNGQFQSINRADGNLVGSFGRVGHQLGEFYNLHFIGIDSKGNVYTAEVQGKRCRSSAISADFRPRGRAAPTTAASETRTAPRSSRRRPPPGAASGGRRARWR